MARGRHSRPRSRRSAIVPTVVALVAIASGVAWAGVRLSHTSNSDVTSTPSTSTTTAGVVRNAPLTGVADPSGISFTRSAVVVKIENTPDALPQYGIERADVMYEEIVNGGITRLAAVFNSHAAPWVGPVRSVRPTDTQIVWPIGGVFAYSGGAAYAIRSIATAPVVMVDETRAGSAMFRWNKRYAPHNLFANGAKLYTFHGHPSPPHALFTYRAPDAPVAGTPATMVRVPFPSIYPVTWRWNDATSSWDRYLFGKIDVTGTNVIESPQNVIVMSVNYVNGIGTMSSYANLLGSGKTVVFTGRHEIVGTWSHSSRSAPITYQTSKGPIALTPGQTWVELLNNGVPLIVR